MPQHSLSRPSPCRSLTGGGGGGGGRQAVGGGRECCDLGLRRAENQKEDCCAQVRFATGGGWLPATNLELVASAQPGSAAPTLSRAFDATRETNGLFDSKRRQAAKEATQEGNDDAEVVESGERTIDQLIAGVPTPQELGRREARQLRQQAKAAEENSRSIDPKDLCELRLFKAVGIDDVEQLRQLIISQTAIAAVDVSRTITSHPPTQRHPTCARAFFPMIVFSRKQRSMWAGCGRAHPDGPDAARVCAGQGQPALRGLPAAEPGQGLEALSQCPDTEEAGSVQARRWRARG